MRILTVSDTESEYIWDHFDETVFGGIDLVISAGDLKAEYLSFLVTILKNAPLFYVHGNHDSGYEQNPPEGCDCIEDKLVTYKGLKILGLGGSMRYNDNPRYNMPPYQCTEGQMSRRILKLGPKLFLSRGFDILVTHAPAFGIGDGKDLCHTGFKSFVPFIEKYNPRYMIHGHTHMHYGQGHRSMLYKKTTVIDAFGYHILEI